MIWVIVGEGAVFFVGPFCCGRARQGSVGGAYKVSPSVKVVDGAVRATGLRAGGRVLIGRCPVEELRTFSPYAS